MSKDLEIADLAETLAEFNPPEGSAGAKLKAALAALSGSIDTDLAVVPDSELEAVDQVATKRITYVVALLRLQRFLRREAPASVQGAQANVALGYIRHTEGQRSAGLQLGRGTNDGALHEEVLKLRREVTALADAKARAARRAEKTQQVPPIADTVGSA